MKKNKENRITLKNRKSYFCIPFKNSNRNINLYKFIEFNNSPGWLVSQNKIEEWFFSGIITKKETSYIYGADFKGICINEILSYPIDKALQFFIKLINALTILKEKINNLPVLRLDSIYFLENDKVLFLPSDVFDKIKNIDINYNYKNYSLINNPYLYKDQEKISYNFSTLLYRLLTNEFSFDDNNEDEIYNKIRNLKIIPPKFINPEIKDDVSNFITSLFKNNKFKHFELSNWKIIIEKWIKEGITEKITYNEKEKYKEEYEKQKIKSDKNFKKKIFWEKNHKKILMISVFSIAFLLFSFYLLKNYFRPRAIKGYPPEKVVETFYLSINKLDHITMGDCVIKNAGKSDIDQVLSLYINQKQSIAYTGKSNLIFAEEWDKKGRPIVNPPSYVYGILDLNIKKESGGTETIYTASYEKWEPVINENESDEKRVQYQGFKIKDKVYLTKHKKYWLIYKIDRIEKNKIAK